MNDDASSGPTGEPATGSSRSAGPKRSGTFIYPLPSTPLPSSTPMASGEHTLERNPAGGVGAGTTKEGTSPVTSTNTNGTTTGSTGSNSLAGLTGSGSSGSTDALGTVSAATGAAAAPTGAAPSRRNSMGVASVRIAARLAHGELASRSTRGGTHGDPTVDNDELLQLLGEYLLAGGLEKPEIHAMLGGQPIVVDLQSPHRR